jgi:hypothetical protein
MAMLTTGGTGNCDIYAYYGTSSPLTGEIKSKASAKSESIGNNESITINNPAAGTWYIYIYAPIAYSNVTLRVSYSEIGYY